MSFVTEYFRHVIRNGMQDPEERREIRKKHFETMEGIISRRKALWAQPTRTWGYWRSPEANAIYNLHVDPSHNKLPGRAKRVNY